LLYYFKRIPSSIDFFNLFYRFFLCFSTERGVPKLGRCFFSCPFDGDLPRCFYGEALCCFYNDKIEGTLPVTGFIHGFKDKLFEGISFIYLNYNLLN